MSKDNEVVMGDLPYADVLNELKFQVQPTGIARMPKYSRWPWQALVFPNEYLNTLSLVFYSCFIINKLVQYERYGSASYIQYMAAMY